MPVRATRLWNTGWRVRTWWMGGPSLLRTTCRSCASKRAMAWRAWERGRGFLSRAKRSRAAPVPPRRWWISWPTSPCSVSGPLCAVKKTVWPLPWWAWPRPILRTFGKWMLCLRARCWAKTAWSRPSTIRFTSSATTWWWPKSLSWMPRRARCWSKSMRCCSTRTMHGHCAWRRRSRTWMLRSLKGCWALRPR